MPKVRRVMARPKLLVLGAGLATVLLSLVLLIGASARSKVAANGSQSQQPAAVGAPTLHMHPRVVVALAPGQTPPETAQQQQQAAAAATPAPVPVPSLPVPAPSASNATYSDGPQPVDLRPPTDAQVKAELQQLHVLGLGGSGYVNPFAHVAGLVPERIDMGVDYAGQGPVVALGSGTVFNTAGAGWPGGEFIGIVLDTGPYRGRPYFIAEDVIPLVKVGQHVQAGQVIGSMYNGGSGIETGWASGRGDEPLAAALSQQSPSDPGGWSSAAGVSFDRLLSSAGAPSGIPQGTGVHGRMPAGYP